MSGLYSDLYSDVFCSIPIRSLNTPEYTQDTGYIRIQFIEYTSQFLIDPTPLPA